MKKLTKLILPNYSKWQILEIYYFDTSWYVVQVRQNLETGYKKFKCKKFISWHHGGSKNLTPEKIESILTN